MKRRLVVPLIVLPLVVVLVGFVTVGVRSYPPSQEIVIDAIGPRYELAELLHDAELVIVARAVDQDAGWNSSNNLPWKADAGAPNQSFIYSTTRLAVLRVIRGEYAAPEIDVKSIGGDVGEVRMTFAESAALKPGQEYMLMLRRVTIPTREGAEEAWMPIALGQGTFVGELGGFRNSAGEFAARADFGE
ncbi:MAG: hypothetical protein ACRDMH_15970 [Solirubrobacterales bacterium]